MQATHKESRDAESRDPVGAMKEESSLNTALGETALSEMEIWANVEERAPSCNLGIRE